MAGFIWQATLSFVLLLALTSISTARVIYGLQDSDYRNISSLQGRQAEENDVCTFKSFCSPTSCDGLTCMVSKKRNLEVIGEDFADPDSDESKLVKRILRNPVEQNKISQYLKVQSEGRGLVNLCPKRRNGYANPSFCVQYEFSSTRLDELGQLRIGTGNTQLTGCTVLAVVSSKGVYMCHFWQDLNYPHAGDHGTDERPALGFQPVLNLLSGQGDRQFAVGPALDLNLFTGDGANTYAFICTPRSTDSLDDPHSMDYPAQQQRLVAHLRNLVPEIGVVEYNYNPQPQDKKYYRGFTMFEYDRDADGEGNPDWRLWLENTNKMGSSLGHQFGTVEQT